MIELIKAWEYMYNKQGTHRLPDTIAKITTGNDTVYIVPVGASYVDGQSINQHVETMTESEFNDVYSLVYLESQS